MSIEENQLKQFDTYYKLLVDWNSRMNLTAITEREQVYVKHFYDSLSLAFFMDLSSVKRMADIGSGAGFPSIPLKIMFPHLKITIIDSLNKRIQFLNELVNQLQLDNVHCLHARAEDAGRQTELRDQFDLVTARAVARLNVLNELCLPFVKPGGTFAAMKGAQGKEETEEAAFSLQQLNGSFKNMFTFSLPADEALRHIIVISKQGKTPNKFPRKAGTPVKSPLII